MVLLLIIADDFTGALDTGVQFAAHGIRTRVIVDPSTSLTIQEAEVLVVDTETRHLPPRQAHDIVFHLTQRARSAGVRYIYKKTDSALRGNIGAELAAVLEASGCRCLPFLPAFPQIGRVTREGIHYIDGVPVTESPFGADPFEPVRHASITELIAEQCELPAKSCSALTGQEEPSSDSGILIYDAQCTQDLFRTARRLLEQKQLSIMAGCAGFAAVLPELLGLSKGIALPAPRLDPRLLVVCGSVNPITLAQLDHAEQAGFARLRLTPHQKLTDHYWQSPEGNQALAEIEHMLSKHPYCMIETNDPGGNQLTAQYAAARRISLEEIRLRISSCLGSLVGKLFKSSSIGTLLLTGGDTLLQCMNCVGVQELEPVCELEKGVVLTSFTFGGHVRHIITKSGGFGQETLLTDLAARIAR